MRECHHPFLEPLFHLPALNAWLPYAGAQTLRQSPCVQGLSQVYNVKPKSSYRSARPGRPDTARPRHHPDPSAQRPLCASLRSLKCGGWHLATLGEYKVSYHHREGAELEQSP